ncbi:hypothetical protein PR001_g15261 [Phytophthora rubi]|uniref:RxLR effector protein n=1 Tax=Phytophthora rubi TaxID=129364 RepID=A0A6A3L761_9STRA|nr:hypothetical protein PR001_g15261 [Phytophthora rubi]
MQYIIVCTVISVLTVTPLVQPGSTHKKTLGADSEKHCVRHTTFTRNYHGIIL